MNPTATVVSRSGVDAALRAAVAARILDDPEAVAGATDRGRLRLAVARALAAEGVVVTPMRWAQLVRDLVDELGGLGPLEALLRDPDVTDVMVNAPDEVYVDRAGRLERVETGFSDDAHVTAVLGRVLGPLGVRLDRAHPWADAVLPGGVRLHALLPPLAAHPTITLRRVPPVVPAWDEFVATGAVPAPAAALLREAVANHRNLVVCGKAGVGKTTLLSRLLGEVGDDRVVVIEDAPELAAPVAHLLALRVHPPTPDGAGGVDVATLVRNALRMRPDRIVVGEVRGAEVADVLQAMNTGHAGSMTTVHANGAVDALVRLEGMALLAGVPLAAARAQLATAIDLVAWLGRAPDRTRRLAELVAVDAHDGGPRPRTVWRRETMP
ncbi:MAG: Flp pilus assembly complex ATPase component TadA [Actinobacteria bacterium]|nr:Flp pilus assembly complex ATPase component TadA [Actinomycetota bacterium]